VSEAVTARVTLVAAWRWAFSSARSSLRSATGPASPTAPLASYAGLAPVTRQSGTSVKGESKSRRGNHRLKNAMFLAAFASLRDPESKTFYDPKRAEGKKHNAALICLARRRCDVILAMLRDHERYLIPTEREEREAARQAARAA
jgi:transposase